MTTMDGTDIRRDPLREAIGLRFAGLDDSGRIARTTLGIWGELAERLTPIVGLRGVDALLGRSLHLTSLACPWLGFPGAQEEGETLLGRLGARLEGQDRAAAAAASLRFFLTLTALIAGLIGEPLTDRLLAPVWASQRRHSERSPQ